MTEDGESRLPPPPAAVTIVGQLTATAELTVTPAHPEEDADG